MASSSIPHGGRYQREQRFTVTAWAMLLAVGAILAAYHAWSTGQAELTEDAAIPLTAPTLTVDEWLTQARPSIDGLVNARNSIAAAAFLRDIPATGAACRAADDAVTRLRVHLPSPDATVNQPLQQAISSYTRGLPDCMSAARTVDGEGMQRAAGFISQGDDAMQMALDVLGTGAAPASTGVLIV